VGAQRRQRLRRGVGSTLSHLPPTPGIPTGAQTSIEARLRVAGCVFAEDEAALMVEGAASPDELESMVARRVAGLPLEQVLGWAEFCGLRIVVEPGVFVPRRRTALLVEQTLALLERVDEPVVVELCCGSGAVAAAVHDARPDVELHASDVESRAVHCARRNLDGIGRVHEGDLTDALPDELAGRVDVIVVNAPYVPSDEIALMPPEARDHEPRVALDGGADGVDVHRRVAGQAPRWLRAGGHLVIETSQRQSPLTVEAMTAHGFDASVVHSDVLDATAVVGTPSSTR
jgi:release factor glutamine methyltransferase